MQMDNSIYKKIAERYSCDATYESTTDCSEIAAFIAEDISNELDEHDISFLMMYSSCNGDIGYADAPWNLRSEVNVPYSGGHDVRYVYHVVALSHGKHIVMDPGTDTVVFDESQYKHLISTMNDGNIIFAEYKSGY